MRDPVADALADHSVRTQIRQCLDVQDSRPLLQCLKMAAAVAEGARAVQGTYQVTIKRVPELVPEEVAKKSGLKLNQRAPVAGSFFDIRVLYNYNITAQVRRPRSTQAHSVGECGGYAYPKGWLERSNAASPKWFCGPPRLGGHIRVGTRRGRCRL